MTYRDISDTGRLHALLGSVLFLDSDLEINALLQKIVEEGLALTGAKYGALGVLEPSNRHLDQLIYSGIEDETVARIGDYPGGKGILGLLINEPQPIRLTELSLHRSSIGFPAHHPSMTSFLGVPIGVRDTVYGNFYLTDKYDGEEFTAIDLGVLETLALVAGIAIFKASIQERKSRQSVAEDRSRIARDLRDTVIQRLFGIAFSLHTSILAVNDDGVRARLEESVEGIDLIIREIRTAAFTLESVPEI